MRPRTTIAGTRVPKPKALTVTSVQSGTIKPGMTITGLTPDVDLINEPPHYQSLSDLDIECLDAQEAAIGPAAFIAHLRATILGYTWRCTRKGEDLADAKKIQFYANLLVQKLEE